jgi:hypothetical protein
LAISFFFWSPAALETLSKLLTHGTRMSSSMYNKLSFSFDLKPHLKRWDRRC